MGVGGVGLTMEVVEVQAVEYVEELCEFVENYSVSWDFVDNATPLVGQY